MVECAKGKEHQKRQEKIDKHLYVDGKKKQILRNIHLREDSRIGEQAPHATICGLGKPIESE
jgi:hypothetical protein